MNQFREIGISEVSCCIGIDEIMREIQRFQPRQIGLADIETAVTANTVMIYITQNLPK